MRVSMDKNEEDEQESQNSIVFLIRTLYESFSGQNEEDEQKSQNS